MAGQGRCLVLTQVACRRTMLDEGATVAHVPQAQQVKGRRRVRALLFRHGMHRILVTDGDTRAALAAVRSLGQAGYVVHVAAPRLPALATCSRHATSAAVAPPRLADPATTLNRLVELVARWRIDVVIPVTDATMEAVLGTEGNRIGGATVAGPSRAAYEALADKAKLLEHAGRLGLVVPRSVVAESPGRLPAAVAEVGYPCVLKPHRSIVSAGAKQYAFAVRYAASAADLEHPVPECAYPVVVQEQIVGVGEGVFLLMDRGRRVAAFAHRRLREKPPSGGVSVYRESVALPRDLADRCEQLLGGVGWHGAAMVEFK